MTGNFVFTDPPYDPASVPPDRRRTTVYRFFDAAGTLLYVGVTDTPSARFGAHRNRSKWWDRVDPSRTTLTWYDNRPDAEAAELDAIKTETPEFNLVGKDGYRGGRPKTCLTPEVAARADRVVELFERRHEIEAEYKRALAELTSSYDVPIAYVAAQLGLERKTVYRHLGRSMT